VGRKSKIDRVFDGFETLFAEYAEYDPLRLYNSRSAAKKLGVCTKTLYRLTKCGVLPAFRIPSQIPGRSAWRYRQEDLDEFVLRHSNRKRYWDPEADDELPAGVAARLLGVTTETVYVLKSRGKLVDYQPETIREYLQRVHCRK
jgi:hypothetical protein